jgi:1,4-alpha-glucan branching enzyme
MSLLSAINSKLSYISEAECNKLTSALENLSYRRLWRGQNPFSREELTRQIKADKKEIHDYFGCKAVLPKAVNARDARNVVTSFLGALNLRVAHLEALRTFQKTKNLEDLPVVLRHELYRIAWIVTRTPSGERLGELAVHQDLDLLFRPAPPFLYDRGESPLEQMIAFLEDLETPSLCQEGQRRAFLRLIQSHPDLIHKQLKAVYKRLPQAVKDSLPSEARPPYYGRGIRADLHRQQGCTLHPNGALFRVYAPHAQKVEVVTLYNGCPGTRKEMRQNGRGTWWCDFTGVQAGWHYEYHITTQEGKVLRKKDPFAFQGALRESIAFDPADYVWNDAEWQERRREQADQSKPLNIYELYPPCFKRPYGTPVNWKQLAEEVIGHCGNDYTHVELMGLLDHPDEASWGYQIISLFAPNHRMGSPRELQEFVDALHQAGIGVILDFIPNHFAVDSFGLAQFDGSALFEHPDAQRAWLAEWTCWSFNMESEWVRNVLCSSLSHWLEYYHIDGVRFDAADYIAAGKGGRTFLRDITTHLHRAYPGVLSIAESCNCPRPVTQPVAQGGLGFDYQWGMGWMHHILVRFLADHPHHHPRAFEHRPFHYDNLIRALECHAHQKVVLSISHDEVSNLKNHLFEKMPGDEWQKFAGVRMLLGLLMCSPGGGKLSVMGSEFAQREELSLIIKERREFPRYEMAHIGQFGIRQFSRDLNQFYKKTPAFWANAKGEHQLLWVNRTDWQNCVISYLHKDAEGNRYVCVHHCRENGFAEYTLQFLESQEHLQQAHALREVLNSDRTSYGGSGRYQNEEPRAVRSVEGIQECTISLPPLSTLVFRVE